MIGPVSNPIAVSSLQGMEKAQAQLDHAATNIAAWPDSTDTIDLSAQAVAMISARDNFMANVEAARSGDQMQRDLLNMVG
jgi:hypothetical protein